MGNVNDLMKADPDHFEGFVPCSGWTEDPMCHYLRVDLPDFKEKDIVTFEVDANQVTISGLRALDAEKCICFDHNFKVPENVDISRTTRKLEDGILTVTIPKQETEKEEPENKIFNGTDGKANEKPQFEGIVTSSGWIEDLKCHYLRVDLPDFKENDIAKFEVDANQVTVSGQRQLNEEKYICFDQTFKVPENADISKITRKFEDGLLTVAIPKQETEKEPANKMSNGIEENANEKPHIDGKSNKSDEKRGNGYHSDRENKEEIDGNAQNRWFAKEIIKGQMLDAVESLKERKQILITAALAFSLGLFLSRKLRVSN